jgi:hypothetical protein
MSNMFRLRWSHHQGDKIQHTRTYIHAYIHACAYIHTYIYECAVTLESVTCMIQWRRIQFLFNVNWPISVYIKYR